MNLTCVRWDAAGRYCIEGADCTCHESDDRRMIMSERLAAVLDEARLVKYDPDGYVLAWFGGESTGIHVYDAIDGTEVGYWQIMLGEGEVELDASDVRGSMIEHMQSSEAYPS